MTTQNFFYMCFFIGIVVSCTGNTTPKPRGFPRIELPTAQYNTFATDELPYSFAVSRQATIELPPADSAVRWMNIDYPRLNAKIYCSYQPITPRELDEHTHASTLLSERAAKNAHAITEKAFENQEQQVYGTLFLLEGDAASPIQFMLTDSVSHFFRGALYYKYNTNADSIAPVTSYLQKDILELIQTFYWK